VSVATRRRAAVLAAALPLALAFASAPARAACERVFKVPLALSGYSVMAKAETLTGVYPELLRTFEAKNGCRFTLSLVPRARQEALFMGGHSDLMLPVTRTPARERYGYFIPMTSNRATAIRFNAREEPLHTMAELVADKTLRVVLVRGYDYGEQYQAMIKTLKAQGRLSLEATPVEVARLLHAGMADLTLMAPSIMLGALRTDPRVADLAAEMRSEPLDDLPWTDVGVYISRTTVSETDRAALEKLFTAAVKSGAVWDSFKRHYPADVLSTGIRPR
jgi:polar amino acid transport system substrate-binding protein